MAQIFKKDSNLKKEYFLIKKRILRNFLLCFVFVFSAVVGSVIMQSTDFFTAGLVAFVISTIGFIISAISATFSYSDLCIIRAGISGEEETAKMLLTLPKDYFCFQNLVISFAGRKSELDFVVVGKGGIFIIETKNRKGEIIGNYNKEKWVQIKTGWGGNRYENEFYSPVKQVGTHIYRLAKYLKTYGIDNNICGIVYFRGAHSLNISGKEGCVPITANPRELKKYITSQDDALTAEQINTICNILKMA
jgi:hypothetical protein